jgi:predicted CXXCH cytochrome family protein
MLRTLLLTIAAIALACSLHAQRQAPPQTRKFVGSAACKSCHQAAYNGWRQTRMANVVRDPKIHPDAVLGDFTQNDPVRTFGLDQVAFVYGSRWKQRYFEKRGSNYYPLPAQWDIEHRKWLPYHVPDGADWWTPYYGKANTDRPTGPTCDGCHSVNYNLATRQVTEWNVGCEKCHGPGSEHVAHPTVKNIVNPGRLDSVRGNDVCMQCHTQGRPVSLPIHGEYVDWPVGYLPGDRLADLWHLEEAKLGTQDFYFFPDGSAHKNRMQGNDFVQSVMYTRGITCASCHDIHGTEHNAELRQPAATVCLQCHGAGSPNGPRAKTIEQHTHHRTGSAGSQCIACHMPKIAQEIGDVMVRSHTFKFIPPSATETLKIPNACTGCHTDKSNAWASETLRSWPEFSPWRVGGD